MLAGIPLATISGSSVATVEACEVEVSPAPSARNVLIHARDLYAANPAHGLPHITSMATGERSQCAVSAVCTAGFSLGAHELIGPALKSLMRVKGMSMIPRLAEWEGSAGTDEVLSVFDDAIGATA